MRLNLPICATCEHLSRDHLGGKGRCQHQDAGRRPCKVACAKFTKLKGGNKFNARKVPGVADSQLEGDRFGELALLLKGGVIRDLEIHPRLEVQPPGCKTIFYKPDSRYRERQKDGRWVLCIEDSKATGVTTDGRWPVVWALTRWKFPHALLRISERRTSWGRQTWVFHDSLPAEVA